MKPYFKILGTLPLGYELVQLVARGDTGGEFHLCSPRTKGGVITIGVEHEDFSEVVGTLLHEAIEYSLARMGCRYVDSNDMGHDHAAYVFMMTHPQFSDALAKSATFVEPAIPLLRKASASRQGKF